MRLSNKKRKGNIMTDSAIESIYGKQVFNGMVNVTVRDFEYNGFHIVNKLDMGSYPHLSHANSIRTGFVVTKDGCNAMPGAIWFKCMLSAKAGIDLWMESGYTAELFWKLMEPYRA
jgi:hypothetical protein